MGKIVKSVLAIAFFLATAMWALDPSGIYEPLTAFLAAALATWVHFSNKPKPSTLTIDGQPLAFDLSIGWNESPQSGERTAWLEWRTRLTPLIGREAEQTELREWANAPHPLSFKVIQADGGVGKTRLAAELAQSLLDTKRWAGGRVSLATFERAQRLAWQGNTIVVVDYPEHSPERLAQLMAAAKEGLKTDNKKHKLRILLLCRSSEGINDLLNKQGAQSYVSKAMSLGELAGKGNLNLLIQSLAKLKPKAPSVSQDEFQAWLDQSSLHNTALFVIALAIHLSTSPIESNRFLPGAQLLQALLKREQARWEKAEEGYGLREGVLTDVLAFATLFDGLPLQAINTSLNEAYKWPANTLGKLHSALAEVWPMDKSSQSYPAMAPDLLAAVLLWQWQNQAAKIGVLTDAKLLADLAPVDQPGVTALLQRWHMQAYDQTTRLQLGKPQDAPALSGLLQNAASPGSDFAKRLKLAFLTQTSWVALADLAIAIGKPRAEQVGRRLGDNQLTERAAELNNHAVHLASAGDRPGALKAAQEAVDIYRRLAKTNPAAYEPALAMSINNLANFLSQTGDRLGALNAALEAVDIRRRLANTNPATYEPGLARSINNLASFLSQTGDHPGAFKAALEAVDMRRRLAKTNPAAYEPDLAASINTLANRLSETGDRPGALYAAQEAVDIYRRLAKTNPAAYEPVLAGSINNLADCLSETGDRPGALKAALEAVALYEKANKETPGAFAQQLAIAKRVRDGLL